MCITGRLQVVLLLAVWSALAACSDVSTADTPQEAKATASESHKLADGREEDLFRFDEFETRARVDVLFVDDNSDSMRNAQQRLADRLKEFLSGLAKIDWQIGITTTDVSDGTFGLKGALLDFPAVHQRFLTTAMPNAPQLFANAIVRDETWTCQADCPSTDERPLRATIQAVGKRDDVNAGFFRADADLVVIVLSDEDEGSSGSTDVDRPEAVIAAVADALGAQKVLTGFAVIVQPGDKACYAAHETLGGHYGEVLAEFAAKTNGETGSICATDYGPTLASIGKRVREGIKFAVLSATPVPETVELTVAPPDSSLTWTLADRTLRFVHAPAPGTKITVRYVVK